MDAKPISCGQVFHYSFNPRARDGREAECFIIYPAADDVSIHAPVMDANVSAGISVTPSARNILLEGQ